MEQDVFDLLMVHEDGYSNLIRYLFETVEEFKNKFTFLLFGERLESPRIYTRTAYRTIDANDNSRKKNIPDIIICDDNHFCIIEVKVYASEGEKQTKNYYDEKDTIKKILKINANAQEVFFYLSLDEEVNLSSVEFVKLSWTEVGNCLPEKIDSDNKMLFILVDQFRERIASIDRCQALSKNSNWNESVKEVKWSGAVGFLNALSLLKQFNIVKPYKVQHWANYQKSENRYLLSAMFIPNKSWIGEDLDYSCRNDLPIEACYSIHYEFEWDEENKILNYRLDYELNPYKSQAKAKQESDPEKRKKIEKCGNRRAEIARECKKIWDKEYKSRFEDGFEVNYNGHITDYLLKLIYGSVEIEDDQTIEDVLSVISPFIDITSEFVENVILSKINNKNQIV
ncbi:MAG: PD-(D/E)XK nuclease family protein [Clostridia bacterium]|nr:PD-(D/E)XK nuclease family protein [Clostridia bacterium]